MGRLTSILLAGTLAFSCAATSTSTTASSSRPLEFSAALEGYGGPNVKLELQVDGILVHTWNPDNWIGQDGTVASRVPVTAAQWAQFRRDVDAAGVWSWQENYPRPPESSDGLLWEVHLRYPDRSITSGGALAIPPAEQFRAYKAAVKKLLGKLPFD